MVSLASLVEIALRKLTTLETELSPKGKAFLDQAKRERGKLGLFLAFLWVTDSHDQAQLGPTVFWSLTQLVGWCAHLLTRLTSESA